MKYLPIEPIANLGDSSTVCDETLVIKQFIKERLPRVSKYKSVIVDNGVFEAFHSNQLDQVSLKTNIVADFVDTVKMLDSMGLKYKAVLPDIPFDYAETRRLSQEAYDKAGSIGNFVGVVQGSTVNEVCSCFDFFNNMLGLELIAIPIKLREYFYKLGIDINGFILNEFWNDGSKIHQLGFSIQDIRSDSFWKTRSFDSTYPFKVCLYNQTQDKEGRYTIDNFGIDPKRTTDYFDKVIPPTACVSTVHVFRNWLLQQGRTIDLS